MPSTIEREVIRKITDLGFIVKTGSLSEASEDDLGSLFVSLFNVYDTSWCIDTTNKGKQMTLSVLKYLRLLDLGHLIPSTDRLRPGNPSIVRCLGAVTQKLEDKHGNKLALRVRQSLKSKPSKSKAVTNMQAQKLEITKEPITPIGRHSPLPSTPCSAAVKLLNGCPIVPGSELRGRELARSPPQADAITPGITRNALGPVMEEIDGSPVLNRRRSRPGPSKLTTTQEKTKNPVDDPPKKRLKKIDCLEPKITDNTIPTGRQLGRTPPDSQQSSQDDGPSVDENNKASDKLAITLDFGGSELSIIDPSQDSGTEHKTEASGSLPSDNPHDEKRQTTKAKRKSIVIPTHNTDTTPVALTCPVNLQLDDNDKEFLQIQENIKKLKELEKENASLTKEIGEEEYKKDLLAAEYEEVLQNAVDVKKKTVGSTQEVRRALADHTNTSPSVLAETTKKTLLTGVHLKMAARVSHLQSKVDKENACRMEMDDTLNDTVTLQTQQAQLESAVKKLPSTIQHAKTELTAAKRELRSLSTGFTSSTEGTVDYKAYSRQRLKVLRDRLELAKQRRVLLKQMNLR